MNDSALMVAEVLGSRARKIVLALDRHGTPAVIVHDGNHRSWPDTETAAPAPFELARLVPLIAARSTIAGTELALTPLGQAVAEILRATD